MAWEKIAEATKPESGTSPDSPSRNVYRFPVPGGWLYIAAYYGVSNMVFVPNPTPFAYDTGYADGLADGVKKQGEKVTHSGLKEAALTELNRVLYTANDTGLFDDIAAHSHPDIINKFCDAVEYFSKWRGK